MRGLGLQQRHFTQAATVARPVKVSRVTRPQEPFLLQELVQALEEDFKAAVAETVTRH